MFRCRKDLFIPDEIKAGDIIGFSGDSWISTLVNIATYGIPFWGLSHVGIMGRAGDGRLMLFESTQLDDLPCEITGEAFLGTQARCHEFHLGRYEETERLERPDLILCNPPFNGCEGKRLYPEIFLAHTFELFGDTVPVALFAPMGFRLNQRRKSARWRWLRDSEAKLSSIIALPLDTFPAVEFHAEVLVFNVKGVRPHNFLPESAL